MLRAFSLETNHRFCSNPIVPQNRKLSLWFCEPAMLSSNELLKGKMLLINYKDNYRDQLEKSVLGT